MNNRINQILLPVATLFVFWTASSASAAWILGDWYLGDNNHYYSIQQISGDVYTWSEARSQAQALTVSGLDVDLATITDSVENAFIASGVNDPAYFFENNLGPYLGGYQESNLDEPAGNWAWVTGEVWSYTNWGPGEPNDFGGIENFLGALNIGSGTWYDIDVNGAGGLVRYYVAETVVPEPTVFGLVAGAGAFAFASTRRRRR